MAGKLRTHEDREWSRIVGEQIYNRRMDFGLTRQKLADQCQCNVDSLANIENGKQVANVNTLYRIARALSCDMGYFFGPIRAAEHAVF
jgi:transcriptional regulator with XRE-family HTH domain